LVRVRVEMVARKGGYPIHWIARSLAMAEALIGQLYPQILIATLVGMCRDGVAGAGLVEG
jgi:hypothetical protein